MMWSRKTAAEKFSYSHMFWGIYRPYGLYVIFFITEHYVKHSANLCIAYISAISHSQKLNIDIRPLSLASILS